MGDPIGAYTCFQYGGNSTVDYAIATNKFFDWVSKFTIEEVEGHLSDHAPIQVKLRINSENNEDTDIQTTPIQGIQFLWNELATENYKYELQSNNVKIDFLIMQEKFKSSQPTQESVDKIVKAMSDVLINSAKLAVPFKFKKIQKRGKQKKRSKPWYNHDCKDLRNTIRKLAKEIQKGRNSAKADFYKFKKQYKKLIKKKAREFKLTLINELQQDDMNKSNEYWEKLKKLRRTEQEISGIYIPFKEWVQHFESKFQERETQKKNNDINHPHVFNNMDNKITTKELKEMTNKLSKNKSCYFDLISTEMLIAAPYDTQNEISKIFNMILTSGIYPKEWGRAYISPLYKKGAKDVANNYRPIAISSCIGKLFNAILNSRLVTFMEEKGFLHDYQNGFKKKARTTDNIFILSTIIDKYRAEKKQVFANYIDLKGAYDCVDRTLLVEMLHEAEMGSSFIKMIESMYAQVEYTIKIGGLRSHFFKTGKGLKQGDTLSPMLFNFYIHKLVAKLGDHKDNPTLGDETIQCLLFADDIILLSLSEKGLKEKMINTKHFMHEIGMTISQAKSKVVVYNQTKKREKHPWIIEDIIIEETDSYSYLGLDITSKGRSCVQNTSLISKGRRAMYSLLNLAKELPVKLAIKLFTQLIQPILLYGAEIWISYPQINRLQRLSTTEAFWGSSAQHTEGDKLQDLFLKKILGVKKFASSNGVRGDTGVFPLYIEAITAGIKFWDRLKTTNNKLLKAALQVQENLTLNKKQSWGLGMERIKSCTKGRANDPNREMPETPWEIKRILRQEFESNWFGSLWKHQESDKGKFLFYRSFKKDFKYEDYLNTPRSEARKDFTKLRISAHALLIEKGRYSQDARNERKCPLCKEKVEDEQHLFECRRYATLRLEFGIHSKRTKEYLQEGTTTTMEYVHKAFKYRKELLIAMTK